MASFTNLRQKTLGAPPPLDEASDNLTAPEVAPMAVEPKPPAAAPSPSQEVRSRKRPIPAAIPEPTRALPDGRSLRKTGRTVQFATRVSPEFDALVRTIAEEQGMLMIEVLEAALAAYDAQRG